MFARTSRLLLRPGWREDAPALHDAFSDRAIVTRLMRAPWPYTIAHAEDYLARSGDGALPQLLILARTGGAPRLVGGIGLHRNDNGVPELGYWIGRRYWGLGFATEAGRAMMHIAEEALRLPRIVAGHFIDNPASGHVLRKLGFRQTGCTIPRASLARDAEVPCVMYARDAGTDTGLRDDPALAA